jgi:hypothetical protein
MKRFKDIRRLDEAARGIGKVDPEGYYAVYKSGGKMKVAGPYSSEAVATDYHYEDLVDVLDGAELVRSRYKGIQVVKESLGLDEANEKKPGKPETMAQKHFRMMPESFRNRKEWLVYAQEVLKDWKSGDMAMSRLEMVMSVLSGLQNGSNQYYGRNNGTFEQFDPARVDAIASAFKKSIGKMERVGRLGKGSGFNPSMGKITPNEITAYIQAVVDFCKGEWASIDKQYGVK